MGGIVGYEVRFDRSISASTRIEFVTEGILTRRLMADPELSGRWRGGARRVPRATPPRRSCSGAARPSSLFVASGAQAGGDVRHARCASGGRLPGSAGGEQPGPAVRSGRRPPRQADSRPLESQVASAIRELVRSGTKGDVLVFLPGAAEIRRAMERAAPFADEAKLLLVALHGDLSPDAQDAALQPAGCQKVIFSTNVAETSVTIEGVEAVIDSGLARIAKYDPWSGRPSLEVAKISRASAAQRAGRAGRLGPGRAVRLYTKGDHDARPEHESPEILRADLAETVLALRDAGVNLAEMKWLDAPPRPAIEGAEQLLFRLGALDEKAQSPMSGTRCCDSQRRRGFPRSSSKLRRAEQPTKVVWPQRCSPRGATSTRDRGTRRSRWKPRTSRAISRYVSRPSKTRPAADSIGSA